MLDSGCVKLLVRVQHGVQWCVSGRTCGQTWRDCALMCSFSVILYTQRYRAGCGLWSPTARNTCRPDEPSCSAPQSANVRSRTACRRVSTLCSLVDACRSRRIIGETGGARRGRVTRRPRMAGPRRTGGHVGCAMSDVARWMCGSCATCGCGPDACRCRPLCLVVARARLGLVRGARRSRTSAGACGASGEPGWTADRKAESGQGHTSGDRGPESDCQSAAEADPSGPRSGPRYNKIYGCTCNGGTAMLLFNLHLISVSQSMHRLHNCCHVYVTCESKLERVVALKTW